MKCYFCYGKGYHMEPNNLEWFDEIYEELADNGSIPPNICYDRAIEKSGGGYKVICPHCKGKGTV